MLALRSVIFNVLFYLNLIVWMIAALPTMLLPRGVLMRVVKGWARSNLFLLRVITGTHLEVRGRENLRQGGTLVASKHQSMWETFALFSLFDDPAFAMKRELMWVPLFGWFAWKAGMISVNRGARSVALKALGVRAAEEIARGRQILIFPEGTRKAPGAPADYKFGIAYLYSETGSACQPVALNSGFFWPRRAMIRKPGTIIVEILPAIEPGLDKTAFLNALREAIESSSTRLLAEAQTAEARQILNVPK